MRCILASLASLEISVLQSFKYARDSVSATTASFPGI